MIACLILAYNEEKYLKENIEDIGNLFDSIIIVNDASTDKTFQILSEINGDKVKKIHNSKNYGAGKSMEIGVNHFLQTDLDYLVKIDGDGQFKKDDIEKLIALSKEDYDFIKCDRFWDKGIDGEIPIVRYIGNSLASLMIKVSTGNWKINDPLNGLFLFSRRSLENFYLPKLFNRYGYPFFINIFMNRKILNNGIKTGQLKNTIKYRDEESKLRPSIMFFKLSFYTFASFIKKILEKFKYSSLQISGLLDILFLSFLALGFLAGIKLLLIISGLSLGSRASWLFLTIFLNLISLLAFYYSQLYEKKIYKDKYRVL
jgi:glycosyltransferase involved in cell wall biosynthesis